MGVLLQKARVAFQGEPGAFSEAAAIQLLGEKITPVPRPTFDATFRAIAECAADALLVPVENSLAGSETILPIELHLIGSPGASLADIRSVASHPMALAQCERFFAAHPQWKRVPAEDTAGSVREALALGNKSHAAIAGRRAADHYRGVILAEGIQDNAENFTRFVLLLRPEEAAAASSPGARKMSIAMRLAHRPGSLLAALEPFARHEVNMLKIESRPIHGRPWEYQFFLDVEAEVPGRLEAALEGVRKVTSELRVLGLYAAAQSASRNQSANFLKKGK